MFVSTVIYCKLLWKFQKINRKIVHYFTEVVYITEKIFLKTSSRLVPILKEYYDLLLVYFSFIREKLLKQFIKRKKKHPAKWQWFNQPSQCDIASFSQLKRISQSGQDTFFNFDLLCLLNNKAKQNVFNWTQTKVFLTVIWSPCLPTFFLFFSRCKCVLKLPGMDTWIAVSIRQTYTTTVA